MSKKTNPIGVTVKLIGGAVAGWIAYSAFFVNHRMVLPPAINAKREIFNGKEVRFLSYYLDKQAAGRPLVLIHSINAAGSSYEMRPIFNHYRTLRPVYALDLPGFGFSERSDREYSPALYRNAILDFLRDRVGEPADVVALSLGCEFAAAAALEEPELFHSLTMISPSGFTERNNKRASQQASDQGTSDFFYNLLAFPLWAQPFFDLLSTKPSIRFFLKQSFEGEIDEGLAAYDYLTTHQPGARFAPLYFVSGKLFTRDALTAIYEKLKIPVLVLYDRDNFVRFDMLPKLVDTRENWQAVRIAPTMGLPHFERMPDVASALDHFWHEL